MKRNNEVSWSIISINGQDLWDVEEEKYCPWGLKT